MSSISSRITYVSGVSKTFDRRRRSADRAETPLKLP